MYCGRGEGGTQCTVVGVLGCWTGCTYHGLQCPGLGVQILINNSSFPLMFQISSVSVSSQDGAVVLRNVHTRSTQSLSSFPKAVPETMPVFVWSNIDLSWSWNVERWTCMGFMVSVQKQAKGEYFFAASVA